jgi:hypothetical protein
MIAFCGIDCSKCKSYIATQSGNPEELTNLAKRLEKIYRTEVKSEYVICDGCKADKKAKIVDAKTGGKPSTGQLIGRYFAYFLSMLPLFLGFIWVAWDRKKQGLHDKLSGTVVIKRVKPKDEPVEFKK